MARQGVGKQREGYRKLLGSAGDRGLAFEGSAHCFLSLCHAEGFWVKHPANRPFVLWATRSVTASFQGNCIDNILYRNASHRSCCDEGHRSRGAALRAF